MCTRRGREEEDLLLLLFVFLRGRGWGGGLCGGLTLPCRNVDKLLLTAVAVADSPFISTITLERCFHYGTHILSVTAHSWMRGSFGFC